jgi:flagellar motor switch protein FliM
VSSIVSAEEVQAILDLARPAALLAAEVASRDFQEPHRLSLAQVDALTRRVENGRAEIATHLSTWLRKPHTVEIAAITEANAAMLVASVVAPFCVIAFDADAQMGFVLLDMTSLVGAVETAVGVEDVSQVAARPLTTVEERVALDILRRVAVLTAGLLGVEAKNFRVLREIKELERWDEAANPDPQRIGVQLAISGPAVTSTVRVYIPGVKPPQIGKPSAPAKDAKKLAPPHLADIDVELRAELGTAEIPLQDLLGLDVGDVIVLGTKVGDFVAVTAEGQRCALAQLGRIDGRFAVQIRTVERCDEPRTDRK